LQIGKSVKISLPSLVRMVWTGIREDCRGQAETIDLGSTASRPPAANRSADGIANRQIARAGGDGLRVVGDWSLTLLATRYDLEDVKRTASTGPSSHGRHPRQRDFRAFRIAFARRSSGLPSNCGRRR